MVITTHLARLDAGSRIFEAFHVGQSLREEPGLHLLCNLQFLRGAPFRFQFCGSKPAVRFDFLIYLVESHKRKRVSIYIHESGEDSAPDGLVGNDCSLTRTRSGQVALKLDASQARRKHKPNATLAPFFIFGDHVLSNKHNAGVPANPLVLFGVRCSRYERQNSSPVRGRNSYPSSTGLKSGIKGQGETELVHIKS